MWSRTSMSVNGSDKPLDRTSAADVPIRVMAVDRHRITLWGLQQLIDNHGSRMIMVATATEMESALELADEVKPDVILLDLDLGNRDASECIPDLIASRHTRVIVLAGACSPQIFNRAVLRGAHGFLRKENPVDVILRAIEKVHGGGRWLNEPAGQFAPDDAENSELERESARIAALTLRERQVVACIGADPGQDNRAMASSLHMSEQTLRNHLSRIYSKLEVCNRFQLYVLAGKHSLALKRDEEV